MTIEKNARRVRFLVGKRVYFTPRTLDDFDDHYRWSHDRELVYLDDRYFRPKSYEKAREEFEQRINSNDVMAFSVMLRENDQHIGLVELYGIEDYERKCYWGIILTKEYWRQGYGTEAAEMLLEYVFKDLGFRRLKSYTHSGNKMSIAFQEKVGFVREGVLRREYFFGGEYVDGIDYGMLREEYFRLHGRSSSG